jgi:hypothetical protein
MNLATCELEPVPDEEHAARAIMFQLLQEDCPEWTIDRLKGHLSDTPSGDIDPALETLRANGVIVITPPSGLAQSNTSIKIIASAQPSLVERYSLRKGWYRSKKECG